MTFDLDQPMFYDLCLGDVGLAQSVATSHHPERMGLASPLTCDAVFCAITAAWNVRPRMRGGASSSRRPSAWWLSPASRLAALERCPCCDARRNAAQGEA